MNRTFKIIISLLFVLLFSGCDVVTDVLAPFMELIAGFLAEIGCAIAAVFLTVAQFIVDKFCIVVTAMISILPEQELPSLSLSQLTVMPYIAFFIPIAEAAGLIKAFIGFFVTFFLGRWFLRWLKLFK
jgi:hypothetical protein